MRAIDAVHKPPVTIDSAATVTEAAQVMNQESVGALVVTEKDRAVGLVTDRDHVVRGLARRAPTDARVDSVMSTDLVTLSLDADIHDALDQFREHDIRRLPLMDGDHVVGVLTVDDLIIDLARDLGSLLGPVAGQVALAKPEPALPVLQQPTPVS